jgi:hypothetical protein
MMPKVKDILLEYRQEGRKTWAIQFYQDGLVKEYSDTSMAFENDKIVTHSRPLAWRELVRLSPAELAKVLAALRKADFFSLPEQVGDPNRVKDGTRYTWIANLEGQKRTVRVVGPEASANPGLKILGEMIQQVTADAFDRQAGEKDSDS